MLPTDSLNHTCPKYAIPKQSYLHGYIDSFYQDLRGYPKSFDYGTFLHVMAGSAISFILDSGGVLKFLAVSLEPFLFCERYKNGFTIWGPIYSLLKEMVLFLNYRYKLIFTNKNNK